MNPGYRYPKYALPPGTPARPAELEVIEGMPVKSTLTAPEDRSKVRSGPMTIRGFAWAGENAIERVEVSTRRRGALAERAAFAAEAAVRLAAVHTELDAQAAGLLHDHVARDGYGGQRAADRAAVESLGLPVEWHRPGRRHGGESMMRTVTLVVACGARGLGGRPGHASSRGRRKSSARACRATACASFIRNA